MLLKSLDLLYFQLYVVFSQLVQTKDFQQSPQDKQLLYTFPLGELHKMQNTLVRAFVLVLAVAGFGASSIPAQPAVAHTTIRSSNVNLCCSLPMCGPHDPTYCGMD
jgi:hypothetical protein